MERNDGRKEGGAVMAWIDPKTNWASTDRFNIEDYNRIKGNLEYVYEKAVEISAIFSIQDMGNEKTGYADFFYASEFNLFEQNLATINQNIFTQDYGVAQTFYDNGPFIQWEELNRIESATLSMLEILNRQKAGLRKLSFRLGNMKGVKV